MQRFKSGSLAVGACLPILFAACTADEPISSRANVVDAGKGGSGGMGSAGASGGVSTGGSGTNVTGGSGTNAAGGNGGVGVAGAAGAAGGAGAAGSAGSADPDASDDGGGADVVETGPTVPEASTCAGFALQLDGFSNYASITRNVQDDFTLEAWLKTDQTTLTGNNFWDGSGLIYADKAGNVDDFGTSMVNGHLTIGVGNPDTTLQGTSMINSGQWVHIATTRQKSTGTLQVIVNGILEASKPVPLQVRSLSAPTAITIGGNTVDMRYLAGLIDEVRIWNVVRTPAEILATMHKTLTGNEAGLVGYWRFDEGTGTTSGDRTTSKGGGDATLTGAQFAPSDAPICQ